MKLYNSVLQQICPGIRVRHSISEGHGASVFWTEKFHDSIFPGNRRKRRKLIQDMDTTHGLPLVVADWGSSSLNLEVQTVYFNDSGHLLRSQSSFTHWVL